MDVLGFSRLVRNSVATGTVQRVFEKFRGQFLRLARDLGSDAPPDPQIGYAIDWRVMAFSDNVVLGVPSQIIGVEMFNTVVGLISSAQLTLALEGYFVRGGISKGLLFMDHEMVYGPALIDAHDLEHSIALHPRIVLSRDLHQQVSAQETSSGYPDPLLLLDSEGAVYLNYMENLILAGSDIVDWNGVDTHRALIEEHLTELRDEPEVRSKFCWLAQYHNAFCDNHSDGQGFKSSLRIDEGSFAAGTLQAGKR